MKDLIGENMSHEEVKWDDLTPVQQFYYGKQVFITGATGTVGKLLLEKLLRSCPGIGTIYLLIRPKKGLTVEERIDRLFDSEVYDLAKKKVPNLKKKVRIIFGDLQKPGLAISETDAEELKDEIQIAFHVAASVRWDNPLRLAAEYNIWGTKQVLHLVKQFTKLESFIYVSTVFVHRDPDHTVPEHVPKMRMTPTQLLTTLEWLDDEAVKVITPSILREKSNTYLFTKAVAENLIAEERDSIPTAIVRPGIVMPVYREPIPGYCDTIQGPQGAFIAAAKGFLRTGYSFRGLKFNVIPVDIVINTLVTTGWYIGTYKQDEILVVNSVLDYDKLPPADEGLIREVMKKRDEYPLVNMYRYPDFTLYYTPFFYYIHALFDHYIPAVVGDTLLFIFTGKPIMFRLYRRISFMFGEFLKQGKDPWIGRKENYHKIMSSLSKKDNELFNMETEGIDWLKYIDDMLVVGRRVIAKEDPSNIPYAKKKAYIWWLVTTIIKWMFILFFLYYVMNMLFPDNVFSTYTKRTSQVSIDSGPEL